MRKKHKHTHTQTNVNKTLQTDDWEGCCLIFQRNVFWGGVGGWSDVT